MTRNTTPAGARLDAPRRIAGGRRAVGVGALSLILSLALVGCSSQPKGTYIEGWWDNGDPFYAPSKSVLFDENGVPTCEFPVKYSQFETRSDAVDLARGVAFEIMNPELDPNGVLDSADFPTAADQANERLRRERALGSLDILWQYTHPLFDAENGIDSPAKLAPIKAKLQKALFGLGREGMLIDYLEIAEVYFVSETGTFVVERLADADTYFADHGIPLVFDGFKNEYYVATSGADEYVLVVGKETGAHTMWMGDQSSELGQAVWFSKINVRTSINAALEKPPVKAEFLVQSDGCPDQDGHAYMRYYLRSFTLLDPTVDQSGGGATPEPIPSPSPSPIPSPSL